MEGSATFTMLGRARSSGRPGTARRAPASGSCDAACRRPGACGEGWCGGHLVLLGLEGSSPFPRTGADEYDRLRELSGLIGRRPAWLGSSACGGARSGWPSCCCAVGVVGGYAVADRTEEEPSSRDDARAGAGRLAGRTRRLRTQTYLPDPDTAPLAPDLPSSPVDLRVSRRGARGHGRHPRRLAAEPGLRDEHVELRQAGQPVLHLPPARQHRARPERLDLRRQGRPDRGSGGVRRPTAERWRTSPSRPSGRHLRGDLHLRWLPPGDHGEVGLVRRQPRLGVGVGDRPHRRRGGAARPAQPDHRSMQPIEAGPPT